MNKPEKVEPFKNQNPYNCRECDDEGYSKGYNKAIKDYEAFLPSLDELYNLIIVYHFDAKIAMHLAKAIAKRIGVSK